MPAGAALAVDRERFADDRDRRHRRRIPLITVVREEVHAIPRSSAREPVIVATGPLTSDALSADIARLVGARTSLFLRRDQPDRPGRDHRSRRRCSARRAGGDRSTRPRVVRVERRARGRRSRPGLRRRRWRGRLSELSADARRVRARSTTRSCTPSRRPSTISTRRSSSRAACRSR